MGTTITPVMAGGSCQINADCNDNNACTTDVCVSNNCQHNPGPAGASCGDPSDTVCTNPDTCSATGVCLRNDAANGTACTAPNPCISGESCNSGFCVGTWTSGCCATVSDCNDYNPCTNDTCVGNTCQHVNAASGTPCGSSVNDACTDPDTCNASGECQTNDTADGESCGGPECLGGQCGGTTYRPTLLPEGPYAGSEGRDGWATFPNDIWVVGRVIDAASVDHAAAWSCYANGTNCTLTLLPDGGASTSVANAIACNTSGTCLAMGSKGIPKQPLGMTTDGGGWTAMFVPLPPTHTGATIYDAMSTASGFTAVGASSDPQGFRKAGYWGRTCEESGGVCGDWSVLVLPDFGVPGRESVAMSCSDDATPPGGLGSRVFGGWAQDGQGIARPVVWHETGPSTGVFNMAVMPLPPGAVQLALQEATQMPLRILGSSASLWVTGTIVLVDGTTRAGVWKTSDFQNWTATVLSPSPGFDSSAATGAGGHNQDDLVIVITSSMAGSLRPTGGPGGSGATDAPARVLSHNRGVDAWTTTPTLGLISGPRDINTVVFGLPAGYHFSDVHAILRADLESAGTDLLPGFIGSVVFPSPVAGTPQPHAAFAIAGPPAGIPAVSTWSLAILALLLLTAATRILRSRVTSN